MRAPSGTRFHTFPFNIVAEIDGMEKSEEVHARSMNVCVEIHQERALHCQKKTKRFTKRFENQIENGSLLSHCVPVRESSIAQQVIVTTIPPIGGVNGAFNFRHFGPGPIKREHQQQRNPHAMQIKCGS